MIKYQTSETVTAQSLQQPIDRQKPYLAAIAR
jgi:hypothetical protein